MKLNKKYCRLIDADKGFDNQALASKCVIIADNYADAFGNWLRENDDEDLLISELLEIFIKEKGL